LSRELFKKLFAWLSCYSVSSIAVISTSEGALTRKYGPGTVGSRGLGMRGIEIGGKRKPLNGFLKLKRRNLVRGSANISPQHYLYTVHG